MAITSPTSDQAVVNYTLHYPPRYFGAKVRQQNNLEKVEMKQGNEKKMDWRVLCLITSFFSFSCRPNEFQVFFHYLVLLPYFSTFLPFIYSVSINLKKNLFKKAVFTIPFHSSLVIQCLSLHSIFFLYIFFSLSQHRICWIYIHSSIVFPPYFSRLSHLLKQLFRVSSLMCWKFITPKYAVCKTVRQILQLHYLSSIPTRCQLSK